MDDPEQRAALNSRLDLERHGAFREWSAFVPHSVPDLDAGNGRDGLRLGEVSLGQPSLAKSRNRDGPPYLVRRSVEFILERDLGFLNSIRS